MVKTASVYKFDNFCKTGNYVIDDVIIWVQDGNLKKNQHNPIKTVGRDSFLSPKIPKNTSFLGVIQPHGSHSPYILGDTTRPGHVTRFLV